MMPAMTVQFRPIVGYSQLAQLVTAIERRHENLDSKHRARHEAHQRRETVTARSAPREGCG